MIFGEVATSAAEGALVAHAIVLPNRRLKKGHALTAVDIKQLQDAGIARVTVARLEDEDIGEDCAAQSLAQSLLCANIEAAAPFTGRVNIYASRTGIFHVNKSAVDAMNKVSPEITLATLNNDVLVSKGRMVATVKIIPFAVNESLLKQVLNVAKQASVIDITTSNPAKTGLVATQLPVLKTTTMDKTARILGDRLKHSGSEIIIEKRVDHEVEAVSSALRAIMDQCELIIIFGASAITDIDDVIPCAIRASGGEVDYFGMPVDPGNLLLVGNLNGIPIIGAPGCARSPAENGFDWVLQRLLCGLPVDGGYISGLGVGGLLMEISARPQPREG